MDLNTKNKRGLSLTEILVAFTIFVISMLAVVYLYYNVLRINTNTSLAEAAMQNVDVIASYLRSHSRSIIQFEDSEQPSTRDHFIVLNANLIQSTPSNNNNNFVNLNSPPLQGLNFVKPTVFQRNIRVETLWNREGRNNALINIGYHRVAVYTITIRWRDKNTWKTVRKVITISRDEVR